jgi:membrane-bound metal-dependent hydrolase YbcI (DUF457 family)
MAQAGMHGMVGMITRKWTGAREWLLLGAILGSFIPDMDNLGVAIATLTKIPTEGIHRTLTHSIFFVAAVVLVFFLLGQAKKDARWTNLGLGLGLGILLHILLDLLIWFNGVEILWPLPSWINLWEKAAPPAWFMTFMDPAEFLFFGLYLWVLGSWARNSNTDTDFLKTLRIWMLLEFALFVIFIPLAYIMTSGFLTIYGALYLFSLFMVFFVTIRMRETVEAAVPIRRVRK